MELPCLGHTQALGSPWLHLSLAVHSWPSDLISDLLPRLRKEGMLTPTSQHTVTLEPRHAGGPEPGSVSWMLMLSWSVLQYRDAVGSHGSGDSDGWGSPLQKARSPTATHCVQQNLPDLCHPSQEDPCRARL